MITRSLIMRSWSPRQNYMGQLRALLEWRSLKLNFSSKLYFWKAFQFWFMTNFRGHQFLSFQKHSMLICDLFQNSDPWLIFQIYFMSLNVKSITETARYSLATFIATIGGSMGAWVGFSVCMVFEVPSSGWLHEKIEYCENDTTKWDHEMSSDFTSNFGAIFMGFYHLASGDWVADWPWGKPDLPKQDVMKAVCIYKPMLMDLKSFWYVDQLTDTHWNTNAQKIVPH